MTIESWKFGNPELIADRLIVTSEAEKKREAKKKEVERKNKGRRIRALVKRAKSGGAGIGT